MISSTCQSCSRYSWLKTRSLQSFLCLKNWLLWLLPCNKVNRKAVYEERTSRLWFLRSFSVGSKMMEVCSKACCALWLAANWTLLKLWWRGGHWTNCDPSQITPPPSETNRQGSSFSTHWFSSTAQTCFTLYITIYLCDREGASRYYYYYWMKIVFLFLIRSLHFLLKSTKISHETKISTIVVPFPSYPVLMKHSLR